jgi:hypothetical protein
MPSRCGAAASAVAARLHLMRPRCASGCLLGVAQAIKIGTTAVGICTSEGAVIAVEKRLLSPLQEPGSVEKIFEVDSHIGCAMSGLSADARTLVDHARSESQYHRFTFNEPMPVESLTQVRCSPAPPLAPRPHAACSRAGALVLTGASRAPH